MSNKALMAATRAGRQAREQGQSIDACPYGDVRQSSGKITWSRAFMRAWRAGWKEADGATGKERQDRGDALR